MLNSFELISNYDLRYKARTLLTGNWWPCISISVIYVVLEFIFNKLPVVGSPLLLLFAGPFQLGFAIFYLNFIRTETTDFNGFFEGFSEFGRAFAAILLIMLFVIGWALLLIIPGIIAAYKYAMTFYILSDDPDVSAIDALRISTDMMDGAKMKLFKLHLSFIGWGLLTILTLGIGQVLLLPYIMTTQAYFYEDLKASYFRAIDQKNDQSSDTPNHTIAAHLSVEGLDAEIERTEKANLDLERQADSDESSNS